MAEPLNYDIVFVGRGYSVSTYLAMADLTWCRRILLIGGVDSWANVIRGDGIINHARHILTRDVSGRQQADRATPQRAALVDENRQIIAGFAERFGSEFTDIMGLATSVRRETRILVNGEDIVRRANGDIVFARRPGDSIQLYAVTYKRINDNEIGAHPGDEEYTVRALKVIYGAGAGPHSPPPLKQEEWNALGMYNLVHNQVVQYPDNSPVMDLDSFMWRCGRQNETGIRNGHVAVVGPNAGIDAAVAALAQPGLELFWMIRGARGTRPAWLPTKHYAFERDGQRYQGDKAIERANQAIINYRNSQVEKIGDRIRINLNDGLWMHNGNPLNAIQVDYYVFAIGQDPNLEERIGGRTVRIGAARVLAPILQSDGTLVPIYDRNHRFGSWFETALGLRDTYATRYTGLEVIGAAAFGLALRGQNPPVRQDYLDPGRHEVEDFNRRLQPVRPGDAGRTEFKTLMTQLQTVTWQLNAEGVRLFDYFLDQGTVPSVASSMLNLVRRLNQRSVGAGDQLGTIRSQIAAMTGYDLIAAVGGRRVLAVSSEALLTATAAANKVIRAGQDAQAAQAAIDDLRIRSNEFLERINHFSMVSYRVAFSEIGGGRTTQFNQAVDRARLRVQTLSYYIQQGHGSASVLEEIPRVQEAVTDLLAMLQLHLAHISVDFNGMTATELAAFLARRYPNVHAEDWEGIIDKIIRGRAHDPYGYSTAQIEDMKNQLELIDSDPRKAGNFQVP